MSCLPDGDKVQTCSHWRKYGTAVRSCCKHADSAETRSAHASAMRPTCHLLLVIVFLGLCLSATPYRDTSRLHRHRQLFQHGTVHDLDSGNFDSTLAALPEGHPVLLEFYASWRVVQPAMQGKMA